MRADALRRRHALLRTARRLVAEHGADVALELVAEQAGVGVATLYRNFPSRAALLDEVLVAILDDVRRVVGDASAGFAEDPTGAWDRCVRDLADLDLGAVAEALSEHAEELAPAVREAQDDALVRVEALLADARGAGLVRQDLSALELVVAVGMVTRPQPEAVRRAAPDLRERLLAILLAGLRAQR